jgi:3-deoxy-manno-octulosonate cytidylyltransferase (CMP-KDO synthetase)
MESRKKTLGVIPARFASTRFPGKPLVQIMGKSMIQRVYEQVSKASLIDHVVVATDHPEVYAHVESFGGAVLMTSSEHQSGTDRCAEVAAQYADYEQVVNIQGDEPFIQPAQIDLVIERLRQISCPIATLAFPLTDAEVIQNPNVVKVLLRNSQAVYFSRQAIPFVRGVEPAHWPAYAQYFKHLGIYAFERDTLLTLAHLPVGAWERAESLEQLRWLEAGFRIAVGITDHETIGIDTPEDLVRVVRGGALQ